MKNALPAHCKFTELYESDLQSFSRTENDFIVDAIRERIFPKGWRVVNETMLRMQKK